MRATPLYGSRKQIYLVPNPDKQRSGPLSESELNDPLRILDTNPRMAMSNLLRKQILAMNDVITIQKQLELVLNNQGTLRLLPKSMTQDPIQLAQVLTGFASLSGVIQQYQISILILASLFLSKEELTQLVKN